MAMLFAAQHPERTRALVLYATTPRFTTAQGFPYGSDPAAMAALLDGLVGGGGGRRAVRVGAQPGRGPGVRAGSGPGTSGGRQPRHGPASCSTCTRRSTCRDILGAIHVPTLVLHRRADHLIRVEVARYLAEHIPGARLVELDGEDHLFFAGDVDALLAEIEEFLTGHRPAPVPADRVLATVLFVDVAGSTTLAARVGDAVWASMRAAFLDAVRRELARSTGTEIDVAGDGVFATFTGPARAIRCALAIREAAAALGLAVRAGVHVGEVQREDGGGLSGLAVHIGARIMAEAEPGEVLVSGTVTDLVVGAGLRFTERGTRTLRGVPGRGRCSPSPEPGQPGRPMPRTSSPPSHATTTPVVAAALAREASCT